MPFAGVHTKARSSPYPKGPERFKVPDDKVDWKVSYPDYKPVKYTADVVQKKPVWADNEDNIKTLAFNNLDKACKVDRRSAEGKYEVDKDGYPLCPMGRTGIHGRGLLGRFGPNHAADPVVTRWKRDPKTGRVVLDAHHKPILEFVGIKRADNGQWALPGGMVDPGEEVSVTVKREFGEEALNALELSEKERADVEKDLHKLFEKAETIYKGYVDDPRNTDNAWMETTALNIHDQDGTAFNHFKLQGGDDASQATWKEYTPGMDLFASHTKFLELTYAHRMKTPPK